MTATDNHPPAVFPTLGMCSTCRAGRAGDEPVKVIRIENVQAQGKNWIDLCLSCALAVGAAAARP